MRNLTTEALYAQIHPDTRKRSSLRYTSDDAPILYRLRMGAGWLEFRCVGCKDGYYCLFHARQTARNAIAEHIAKYQTRAEAERWERYLERMAIEDARESR